MSRLAAVIILLPFVAALLDIVAENLPLWLAARRLAAGAAATDGSTAGLVLAGSTGAALKWSALSVYLIGLLTAFLVGPRGLVLWRVRFSVAAALVGSFAILAVPQGQDILQRLVEGAHPYRTVTFAVAVLTLGALVVWYSGRVLTMVRLSRDREPANSDWQCYFEEQIPRVMGVAVPALAGFAFARAGSALRDFALATVIPYLVLILLSALPQRPLLVLGRLVLPRSLCAQGEICDRVVRAALAVLTAFAVLVWLPSRLPDDRQALRVAAALSVAAAWAVYLFVYFRRGLFPGGRHWPNPCGGYAKNTFPKAARIASIIAAVVSLCLLAGFTLEPVLVGRTLGPLVILTLAVANAVFVGSVLAYFGRKSGFPIVTMLLALAAVFSGWNDNHAIRVLPPSQVLAALPRPEPLRARFERWLSARSERPRGEVPVILVAAAGGGLRAAYWTSVALATLQDRDSAFARHVFAVSGVSGGSLGAAVFGAVVGDLPKRGGATRCLGGSTAATVSSPVRSAERPGPTTACVRQVMSDDFLSPVLAKTLAPDFLQWFIPIPLPLLDRATALEESWERSYAEWVGETTLASPYLSLYADSIGSLSTPLLLLNTTHVQSGRRYVTAPFLDEGAFLDARSVHRALGADLRLSTAVHNSARFSYVSPAGRIERRDGGSYGSLVDGGYFENSGLTTLSDVRREIQGVIDRLPAGASRARVVVLYLCNDPLSCRRDRLADQSLAAERGLAGEWLSPLLALLRTRDARGSFARAALAKAPATEFLQLNVCDSLVSATDSGSVSPARDRVVHPPLGWQLSRQARDWMDASLTLKPVGAASTAGTRDTSRTTGTTCRRGNVAILDSIGDILARHRRPEG